MNAVQTVRGMDRIPSPAPTRSMPAARLYTELGWSIIPVNGTTKTPLVPWRVYSQRRPTLDEIQSWSEQFGPVGIAVITGPVSSIVVLDADGEEGVEEAEKLGVPKTPIARTPRGGAHYYFRLPVGLPAFRNSAKLGESKRLDVRGHAGYVVAPHTAREDGKKYEWVERPGRTALAMPPAWFLGMLRTAAAKSLLRGGSVVSQGGGSAPPSTPPPDDLDAFISTLRPAIQTFIREGHDLEKFKSRSECDYAVILELVLAKADAETIENIFSIYPIGDKFREPGSGRRYLERTIEYVSECIRVVNIKYADLNCYTPSKDVPQGARVHLAFIVEQGLDAGRMIRCGLTVPDTAESSVLPRWRRFFQAVGMPTPKTFDETRVACRKLVGKRVCIELGSAKWTAAQHNPVAAFHCV